MADPLLQLTHASTRAAYLAAVRYSNLTAAIMNGDYRNGIPSFNQFTVQVLDENGQPLADANVKVWGISGNTPYLSGLLLDGLTDENGQIVFPWGRLAVAHNTNDFFQLNKVYIDSDSVGKPHSIY